MDQASLPLLSRIAAGNADVLRAGDQTVRVGPFLSTFHPRSNMIWINYATPLEPVPPGEVASLVEALRQEFRRRSRTLRFEFLEAMHPELGAALERAGLVLQSRSPLMVCGPGTLRRVAAQGVKVVSLRADDDDTVFAQFLQAARRAFGTDDQPVTAEDIAEQRASLAGGRYQSATAFLDDQLAGVGTMTVGSDELVGIGTLPGFRRRGVAATVSSFLVARHFDEGAEAVWLSAGDAAATALYEKIGFVHAGCQLNYIENVAS